MFLRSEHNPILTVADLTFPANSVFNPGATVLADGTTILLARIEDRRGLSAIHVAASSNGVTDWTVNETPLLAPDPEHSWCEWGYEDARVSWVEEIGKYVVTCTAYGEPGPCVYLATTTDFTSIDSGRVVMPPEDKNAALFPRRIDGDWLLLHRPVSVARGAADIWLSRSDDLESWRMPEQLITRRPGGWWDAARIGIGPPPIETAEGWIILCHGVRHTMSGAIYRMGAVLVDLEQPWIVRNRCDDWLLSPTAPYERTGDVGNVVFPCGAVHHREQNELHLYYGAADTTVCLATVRIPELLDALVGGDTGHLG